MKNSIQLFAVFTWIAAVFCAGAATPEPLTTLNYKVVGSYLKVSPAAVAVPKGIAGSVMVEMANADGSTKQIDNSITQGAYVEATLRSPATAARRLIGQVNAPLMLPSLNVVGDYQLDNIRLIDAATGEVRLEGAPSSVPVRVFEEVLVSKVTSRPLTLAEIQEKGIVIDEENFRAVEFEVGFVLDGRTIPVKFPVVAPDFKQSTEIIPAAELEKRLKEAQAINNEIANGGAVQLPDELKGANLNLQIRGANFEIAEVHEKNLRLGIPPIPALMVIPGNIGYLNQFFSVQVFTENAAPAGSGLSVFNLSAKLNLPLGGDQAPGASYEKPGDDPLRFARVGPNKIIQPVQSIVRPGPDNTPGTADDITRLQPKEAGQAEFLVEGLKEGLHVMDLELNGELDGLAAGSVKIKGRAAGSVLVRNPKFSLAFSHPSTVRTGEPYYAYVTVLNTGQAEANLLSITLPKGSVSGGELKSAERVELGNLEPGETKTARFLIVAQRTGRVAFSNLTTSEDSVVGRFRLRMGVDERGVELSPDTIGYPAYANRLPEGIFDAINRVLGQALSVSTSPLLPPGVKQIPFSIIEKRVLEMAEAGQRLAYGDSTNKVLMDLLLDFHGGRKFHEGFDQIIQSTEAGQEMRVAFAAEMDNHDALSAVERLAAQAADIAGRGEEWRFSASTEGARGKLVIFSRTNLTARWAFTNAAAQAQVSAARITTNGNGQIITWNLSEIAAGSCFTHNFDTDAANLRVDEDCDGQIEATIAGVATSVTELPPAMVSVRQTPEIISVRPFPSCQGAPADNYATVLAVLFSKPMTQTNANIPTAYTLDNGVEAQTVRVQPGGRVALLNLEQGIGAVRPRQMTVHGVKDIRGNMVVSNTLSVLNLIKEGVAVNGRVFRGDGSPAANVPVTLTMNDVLKDPFDRCEPQVISKISQVFTDENGGFSFDFIVAGVSYTISATDTGGLPLEAIQAILDSSRGGSSFDRERFAARLVQTNILNSLGVNTAPEAIALAEGLDRAVWNDRAHYEPGAMACEITVALRFRGRASVAGKVVGPDGVTPVMRAAVNLFPDPTSRELGRGIFTDVNGNFQFNGVPLGDFSLQVKTGIGQFRTIAGRLETAGEVAEVLVVLAAPTAEEIVRTGLRGQITEPNNTTPHANASVFLRNSSGHLVAAVKSSADGFWEVSDIPVGTYGVAAISMDGRRKGERSGIAAIANDTNFVQVALNGTGVVMGRVEDSSGRPVANALVAGGAALVRADTNGLFTLTEVPLGQRGIDAGLEGQYAANGFPRFGRASINVLPGVDNFTVVRLRPAGVITGKVRDTSGKGVGGVNVSIPVEGGFAWTKANDNGFFTFINMPPGEYIVSAPAPPVKKPIEELLEDIENGSQDELIAAVTEAFTTYSGVNNPNLGGTNVVFTPGEWGFTKATVLRDGDIATAEVKYFPKGTVSGTVFNHQGVPIGAKVRLTGIGPQEDGSPAIIVRGDLNSDPALGTFAFNNRLMAGDWAVQVASPFYAVVLNEVGRTTGFQPHVTNLVMQFPNRRDTHGRLAGRVFYPNGQLVGEAVKVRTSYGQDGIHNTTDTNGVFQNLIDINEGGYVIEAHDESTGLKGRAQASVVAGRTNYVEVHLLGLGAAEITVRQANGQPAANAEVELAQGSFPNEKRTGRTDANGVFRAGNLPAGKYSFSAKYTTPSAVLQGRIGLDVAFEQTTTNTLTLSATANIVGTFRARADSAPISAARVAIGNLAYVPTDTAGAFSVPGVPLGTYRIVAIDPVTGRKGVGDATLSFQDQTVIVNLVEQQLGELRGQLFEAGGTNVVPGAEVTLFPKDSIEPMRKVTTGPDGFFYFPAVAAGQFTLQGSSPTDSRNATVNGTFPNDGSTLVVNLVLPAKATRARIVVQVENPDGTPATNARVFATAPNSGGNADTDSNGVAIIDNLFVGGISIRAESLQPAETNSRGETNLTVYSTIPNTNVTVRLSGVGVIAGKVFRSNGSNAADFASVTAQYLTFPFNRMTASTIANINGEFTIPNAPLGAFRIVAEHESLAGSTNGVITNAYHTNNLTLTIGASGGVIGRLVRADRTTPVPTNSIVLLFGSQSSADGNAVEVTGMDGRFAFTNVPIGKVTARAFVLRINGLALTSGTLAQNGAVLDLGDVVLDEDIPQIVSISPANTATGVPINSSVDVTYHEPMDPLTVNNNTNAIYLRNGSQIIRSGVSLVAHPGDSKPRVIRITPAAPLKSLTTYEVVVINGERRDVGGAIIANGPRDLVGRAQSEPLLTTFTTRDDDPPVVVSLFPANNSVNLPTTAVPRISFTEAIRPDGISITLIGTNGPVAGFGNVGADGKFVTFNSTSPLKPNSLHTLIVSNVFDFAGNRLVGDPIITRFTTEDTIPPVIAEFTMLERPVAGATVTLQAVLADTNEIGASVRFTSDSQPIADATVAPFRAQTTLPTNGSVRFEAVAFDRGGNSSSVRTFTTNLVPNEAPTLQLTLLTNAPVANDETFTFSVVASDDVAVTNLTIVGSGGLQFVRTYTNALSTNLTFTVPNTALAGKTIQVRAQAVDSLGASSSEERLEVEVLDKARPTLAILTPDQSAVPNLNQPLTLTIRSSDNSSNLTAITTFGSAFSKTFTNVFAIRPNTDETNTLTLSMEDAPRGGGALTVTVTVRDEAGNERSVIRQYTLPDEIIPRLTSISPTNNATRRSLWTTISYNFSEIIDSKSQSTNRFALTNNAGVATAWRLINFSDLLRIDPVEPLLPGVTYTNILYPGLTDRWTNLVTDLNTNAIPAEGLIFTFTTAAILASAPADNTPLVAGQTFTSSMGYEPGLGAQIIRFKYGATLISNRFVGISATNAVATLRAPEEAGPVTLNIWASPDNSNPDYLAKSITLDIRSRESDDDADGWANGYEIDRGMNPFIADPDSADFDNDNLANGEEKIRGTDPARPDSDNDGLLDGQEIALGTNPLNSDTDGDGILDGVDPNPLEGTFGIVFNIPTSITLLEGESTNINFTIASSNAVIASVQFSLTNPPPLFAALSSVTLTNTGTNGVGAGAIALVPQSGDAGAITLTLVGSGHEGTNVVTGIANINVTILPATEALTRWKDPVSGNWHDPDRWTDGIPSTNKSAVIDVAGDYTINLNADATIGSVKFSAPSGLQTLALTNRILTTTRALQFNTNATINLVNGSRLDGPGHIAVAGRFNWVNGGMSGAGTTTFAPGSETTISGTQFKFIHTRTLNNYGDILWLGDGEISTGLGAIINNSGLIEIAGNGSTGSAVGGVGTASLLNNTGQILKSGAANSFIGTRLRNSGVVSIQSGSLEFGAGSQSVGVFTTATDATSLRFSGQVAHSLDLPARVEGPGSFTAASGVINFSGALETTNHITVTADLNFNPGARIAPHAFLTVNQNGDVNFSSGAAIQFNTITNRGSIAGSDSITVANRFKWLEGYLYGTGDFRIETNAVLEMSGTAQKNIHTRRFENAGHAYWANGANWIIGAGGHFTNSGTFEFQTDVNISTAINGSPTIGAFNNGGAVAKTAGAGLVSFGVPFNNSGLVTIHSGGISLERNDDSTGRFVTTTNGFLRFNGGTHNLLAGSLIEGPNETRFLNGIVNVSGNITTPILMDGSSPALNLLAPITIDSYFNLNSGSLGGAASLTIKGQLNWAGGFMNGPGKTLIDPGATARFVDANTTLWIRRLFENRGLVTVDPTVSITMQDGTFRNFATANFEGSANIGWNGGANRFINEGSLNKLGAGAVSFSNSIPFDNLGQFNILSGTAEIHGGGMNSGVIFADTAGALSFDATYTHAAGSRIHGPGAINFLGGNHDLLGSLEPNGPVTFRSGTIIIRNSLAPAANSIFITGSTLQFEAPQTFATLNLQSGAITGPADILITGSFAWTAGALNAGGRLIIGTNATATILPSAVNRALSRILENHGAIEVENSFMLQGAAALNNQPSGTINLHNTSIDWNGNSPIINNAGVINKITTNAFVFHSSLRLNNTGLINVNEGALTLPGGTNSGSILLSANTALNLVATMIHNPGSVISGPAFIQFTGGVHDLQGVFNPQGLLRFSGSVTRVTFRQPIAPTGIVTNLNAQLTFTGPQSFPQFVFNGGSILGEGDVAFTQSLTWTAGEFSGAGKIIIDTNATLTASTTASKWLERPFENHGAATFADHMTVWVNNGQWHNKPGSVLNFPQGGNYTFNGGSPRVINAGAINKAGTNLLEFSSITFQNEGALNITEGAMRLGGGGTNTGSIHITTNATLQLWTGTHTLGTNTAFTGSGKFHIASSSTLRLQTDVDFALLQVLFDSTGAPQGAFIMANSPGGSITFGRTLTLPGSLLIGGALATTAANITVTINGDLILENGSAVDNPGSIQVRGNYLDQGANILKNAPVKITAGLAPIALQIKKSNPAGYLKTAAVADIIVTWSAQPGLQFRIQTSADLANWTTPQLSTIETTPGQYGARLNGSAPHTFIRVLTAPQQ